MQPSLRPRILQSNGRFLLWCVFCIFGIQWVLSVENVAKACPSPGKTHLFQMVKNRGLGFLGLCFFSALARFLVGITVAAWCPCFSNDFRRSAACYVFRAQVFLFWNRILPGCLQRYLGLAFQWFSDARLVARLVFLLCMHARWHLFSRCQMHVFKQ